MKASGITAIGLVAAAGLWIASRHLLPHDSAEGHAANAAIRAPEAVKKPFRVSVVEVRLMLPKVLDERSKELLREFGKINTDDVRHELNR